jgi:hypothetical protein
MLFGWRYLGAEGKKIGASPPFDSREDAEAWLRLEWESLEVRGVVAVELSDRDSGEVLYRMSLEDDADP